MLYMDIKRDLSLYYRFYEAVKILATEMGSLNDRLFKAYYNYLFAIDSDNFKEQELRQMLKYIENIFHDRSKCLYYKHTGGGKLHCHWKESKKMAENIFAIYDCIIEVRCNDGR